MFETIKSYMDFKKVYSSGDSLANRYLVLYCLKRNDRDDKNRYGLTVSKKVGCAVVRNKVKRRLREIIRKYETDINKSYDIVIVSRVRAAEASFQDVEEAFCSLMRKSDLFFGSENE